MRRGSAWGRGQTVEKKRVAIEDIYSKARLGSCLACLEGKL